MANRGAAQLRCRMIAEKRSEQAKDRKIPMGQEDNAYDRNQQMPREMSGSGPLKHTLPACP